MGGSLPCKNYMSRLAGAEEGCRWCGGAHSVCAALRHRGELIRGGENEVGREKLFNLRNAAAQRRILDFSQHIVASGCVRVFSLHVCRRKRPNPSPTAAAGLA